jgi:membrane protease YdiL (CAAX protease family)
MERGISFSGSISAPSRSSLPGAVVMFSIVSTLSLALVVPGLGGKWTLAVMILLLSFAIAFRAIYAIHLALFGLVWVLLVGFVPFFQVWPFSLLAPLLVYGGVVIVTPGLRRSVGWLRMGGFGRDERRFVFATVVVSSMALVAWTVLEKPDLQRHLALIPEMPPWVYPIAAFGFAFLNAAMEEVVFRGVMMEALDSAIGEGYLSVGAQAVSFAALHYLAGFPYGVFGFFMAFVYGVMLGMIRRQARGLLAPWVAHVAADITIFSILVFILVLNGGYPMT